MEPKGETFLQTHTKYEYILSSFKVLGNPKFSMIV